MLLALAAALAASPPVTEASGPTLGRNPWLVATVGHSEWCPAGNVRLDLRTGRYEHTRRASRRNCTEFELERPVRRGQLDPERLASLRAAALGVVATGFESQACRDGTRLDDTIIVSNGGTPTIVLTIGVATLSAVDDLTCWSEAATVLHDLLDETFPSDSR